MESYTNIRDSWIDPNGKLIEVGDMQHNKFAGDYLIAEMGIEAMYAYIREHLFNYPYEMLHDRGWVRVKINTVYLPRVEILGNTIDLTRPMRNTIDPAMNAKQLKTAKAVCEAHNTPLHEAINDKRFW